MMVLMERGREAEGKKDERREMRSKGQEKSPCDYLIASLCCPLHRWARKGSTRRA